MKIKNNQEVIAKLDEIETIVKQFAHTFVLALAHNDMDEDLTSRLKGGMKYMKELCDDVLKAIELVKQ